MARQYCRYCIHCTYNEQYYCCKKEKRLTEKYVKNPNNCKTFIFTPISADMERTYEPQKRKKKLKGQLKLF